MRNLFLILFGLVIGIGGSTYYYNSSPSSIWLIKRSELQHLKRAVDLLAKYPEDMTYTYQGGHYTSLKIVCTADECVMSF